MLSSSAFRRHVFLYKVYINLSEDFSKVASSYHSVANSVQLNKDFLLLLSESFILSQL